MWVDDDRKFVERFFSNVFQSIFFYRWVSACLFFGGGVLFIVVNTLCVCVCMGCFSCKNLLKILQRAADRRRRRRRRANEQIHAGYFLYEVFDDTEFTRLYSR